jgi:hypothetical protein
MLENKEENILDELHRSIQSYKNHELLREITINGPNQYDIYPLLLDVLTKLSKELFNFFEMLIIQYLNRLQLWGTKTNSLQ